MSNDSLVRDVKCINSSSLPWIQTRDHTDFLGLGIAPICKYLVFSPVDVKIFSFLTVNPQVKRIKDVDELEIELILAKANGMYANSLYRDLPVLKANFRYSNVDTLDFEYDGKNPNEFYKSILLSKSIKIRQAVAENLTEIPLELKMDYESLLNDKSYVTIEKALLNLWMNFPQERKKYLDKTKHIQGFNDKNIRILWLALALVSPDFEDKNIRNAYDELTDYTHAKHGFETRQNAFFYLQQINACKDICIENLKQATAHHNWQFSKFAKALLEVIKTN